MNKTKNTILSFTVFFLTAFIISNSVYYVSASDNPDYIYGKVIFSDNNIPVNAGFIKVLSTALKTENPSVLYTTEINQNGTFRIPGYIMLQTDGIKIMAYANDLDNSGMNFEPAVKELNSVLKNDGKVSEIIIKVNRIRKTETGY